MDVADSVQEMDAAVELADGVYASEETLHTSVAFLRNTLAGASWRPPSCLQLSATASLSCSLPCQHAPGLGFCQELNLLSTDPSDVVSVCNTIYGLLLQHQKDSKFKEQIKADLHRMRLELQGADKERQRLENRHKASDESRREEVRAARREADELQKRLVGSERRCVQMQHEIKRKEKEYERLQERLAHYLADKKKHERAVVEMAGKLTSQLGSGAAAPRGARVGASDEGLKAAEYKDMLNRQVRQQQADASSSSAAVEDAFLQRMGSMGEDELRSELSSRMKVLQRRVAGLLSSSATEKDFQSLSEQRMFSELQTAAGVIRDQERLVSGMLAALRSAAAMREAAAQADAKRLAQHYQAQLAAAEAEIQKAKETQADAAAEEVEALRQQMSELSEAVQRREQDAAAAIRQEAQAEAAEVRRQLDAAQQQLQAARAEAAVERDRAAAEQKRAAAAAAHAAEAEAAAAAAAAQQQESAAAQRRFELMKSKYEELMSKYAPGVGAGVFLERAISRKAVELADAQLAAEAGVEAIPAVRA
eukprot:scaffold7.g3392.t1